MIDTTVLVIGELGELSSSPFSPPCISSRPSTSFRERAVGQQQVDQDRLQSNRESWSLPPMVGERQPSRQSLCVRDV